MEVHRGPVPHIDVDDQRRAAEAGVASAGGPSPPRPAGRDTYRGRRAPAGSRHLPAGAPDQMQPRTYRSHAVLRTNRVAAALVLASAVESSRIRPVIADGAGADC